MEGKFTSYLSEIGMFGDTWARARELCVEFQRICLERPQDMFVSECLATNGKRQVLGLWLFSENFIMESAGFPRSVELSFSRRKGPASQWEVRPVEPRGEDAKAVRGLAVRFRLNGEMSAELQASGANCARLEAIVGRYLVGTPVTEQV
ncbi:MAG: hypothetical protein ACYC4R_02925 [Anaerolineae bacterium]